MLRTFMPILVTLVVLLALANVLLHWQQELVAPVQELTPAERRWVALSAEQQQGYVQQYQRLLTRGDGALVLRRAREFAEMPADRRARLRELHRALWDALDTLHGAELRRTLLLPASARAFFAYRILAEQEPERLAALKADEGP
jgi:hypothetical protein